MTADESLSSSVQHSSTATTKAEPKYDAAEDYYQEIGDDLSLTSISDFLSDRLLNECLKRKDRHSNSYSRYGRSVGMDTCDPPCSSNGEYHGDNIIRFDDIWDADNRLCEVLCDTIVRETAKLEIHDSINRSSVIMSEHGSSARDDPRTWSLVPTDTDLLHSCLQLDLLAFESSLRPDERADNHRRLRNLRPQVPITSRGEEERSKVIGSLCSLRSDLMREVGSRSRYITKKEAARGRTSAPGPNDVVAFNL